jgi:hypothetical protein
MLAGCCSVQIGSIVCIMRANFYLRMGWSTTEDFPFRCNQH